MLSIAVLSGETITSYVLGKANRPSSSSGAILFSLAGVAAIVTGLLNWSLFKPKQIMEKNDAKRWIGVLHSKLLVTIVLFTPIPRLLGVEISDAVKFYAVVGMMIVAAYMRYFREAATSHYTAKSKSLAK